MTGLVVHILCLLVTNFSCTINRAKSTRGSVTRFLALLAGDARGEDAAAPREDAAVGDSCGAGDNTGPPLPPLPPPRGT